MIRGERIYLTALDRANAEQARAWINDPDVHTWMLAGHVPISSAEELAFFDKVEASSATQAFDIHLAEDDRHIGTCALDHLDLRHRHAEIGIMIGDRDLHNSGYGRDVIKTLCRFAFDTMGLHTLRISYIDGNEVGAHLYRSIGFKDAGRLRDHVFLRGEFHDLVLLDMLESEWRASRE